MKMRMSVIGGASAILGLCLALIVMGQPTEGSAPGYARDIPGDPQLPPARLPVRKTKVVVDETASAMRAAASSELDYRSAMDANKKQPGTVSAAEVERLRQVYTDNMLEALRRQVESQQA